MCRLILLVFLLAFTVNVLAITLLSGHCDQLKGQEKYDCESAFEKELIKNHSKYFERNDDTLILKTFVEGKSKSFVDKPVNSWKDPGAQHRVIAFYPDQLISHVRVGGYEYFESFVFRHAHGSIGDVFWNVAISPNGKLLVGFNAELETNWRQNAIVIYSIVDWGFKPLVSYHPSAFGITDIKFINPVEIELTTVCHAKNTFMAKGKAYLKFTDSVWQIGQISCNE
jgi:hypothetical protein